MSLFTAAAAAGEFGIGSGGFDGSKSNFALRGKLEYGKGADNAQRCTNCQQTKKETKVAAALRACASCDGARYCGKDCHKAYWKRHKESCKIRVEEKKSYLVMFLLAVFSFVTSLLAKNR
jgi:hypothetical protein